MLRKSVVTLAILCCSVMSQVYALGFGTVTVESNLNQPLRVRIEILELGDTRLEDVTVQLASVDDFARFNIERIGFLSNIDFQVEGTVSGTFVYLTTSQVVSEPYLSFMLDTRWPNGRLLTEHTILLDLPVFQDQVTDDAVDIQQPVSPALQVPDDSASPAQADQTPPVAEDVVEEAVEEAVEEVVEEEFQEEVIAPGQQDPAQEVVVQAVPDVVEEAALAEPEPSGLEPPGPETIVADAVPEPEEPETIGTSPADTLIDIAQQVRPDDLSLQQTMLAIQELNPDAFIDGNINRLRSGQVLRVPAREEIEAINPADAVAEVARQNQQFADVQPLAAPADATPDQDQPPPGQLSVVSADDAVDAASGAGESGDAQNEELDRRIAELENQLALRQEEADRVRIESAELVSRLADLEQQIAAAEELVRLQDLQLAQLRESIALAAQAAEAERQSQPATAASPVDNIMGIVTANTLMVIFAVALVILLLVLLLIGRHRSAAARDDELDELAEREFDADAEDQTTLEVAGNNGEAVEDEDEFDRELDDIQDEDDEEETTSFLDDPGMDQDSYDDDDSFDLADDSTAAAEEESAVEDHEDQSEAALMDDLELDNDDVDMTFDFGAADEAEESDPAAEVTGQDDDDEIDSFEFDDDAAKRDSEGTAAEEEAFDLESFAIDAEVEEPDEPAEADTDNENSMKFGIDEADFNPAAVEDEPVTGEEPETFKFGVEEAYIPVESSDTDESTDTEAADSEVAAERVGFDVEEAFEVQGSEEQPDDDSAFDLDAGLESVRDSADSSEELETELHDTDEETSPHEQENDDEEELDDLGFLPDDDDVENESVDDMEEIESHSEYDETATKLELAYAYRKMDDREGAKEILQEVVAEGNEQQVKEAERLIAALDSDFR